MSYGYLGLRGLWLVSCRCGKVKVDWPQVFPCSAVPFALSLYNVTVWHSSSIDDGHRDVLILDWGLEKHFLPWAWFWEVMGTMGFVKLCILGLLIGEEVVPHTLHVHWLAWLTGAMESPVVQDLSLGRHVGGSWGQLKVKQNIFQGPV